MNNPTHYWSWKKWLGRYYGSPCRMLATGALNQVLLEFPDGTKHVTLRYGLRKQKPEGSRV